MNLPLFPIDSLYSLDDFNKVRQYVEIAAFKILGYFIFLRRICEKNKVNILHAHFGYHGRKMIGLQQALKIPLVCSFYGDDAFAQAYTKGYANLFKNADAILVLGPYMKSALINLGCAEAKINIHHLGIDVEKLRFEERKVKDRSVRFLIASSFLKKKGVDLAIQALSTFKDRYKFSLDIIGDGPLKGEVLAEIEKGGIQDQVKLHGYQPYDYFINLTYQCDVFIQASRTTEENRKEGTPMAIVDAMATGMAVVSTRHSDIPEIVLDGSTGYIAEENNLESLRFCIQKIFDNPQEILELGKKGRERVEKEFNVKIQTEKLEELYTELIN